MTANNEPNMNTLPICVRFIKEMVMNAIMAILFVAVIIALWFTKEEC